MSLVKRETRKKICPGWGCDRTKGACGSFDLPGKAAYTLVMRVQTDRHNLCENSLPLLPVRRLLLARTAGRGRNTRLGIVGQVAAEVQPLRVGWGILYDEG